MILRIILLTLLKLTLSNNAHAQELTVLVSNWAPYHFKENDKIVGISTELIELALQKADVQYKLTMYPFKRALYTVKHTPNTMLYTVAKIPQRESIYKWIGPVHPRQVYLYKLASRTDIQITNIEDIKKYKTGTLMGGSVEAFFKSHDFQEKDDYFVTVNSEQLLKILFKQRADLIPGDPLDLAYQMTNLGYKLSVLEKAYQLSDEGGYYMIANKNTPDKLIAKIQNALDEVLASEIKDQVINKYIE